MRVLATGDGHFDLHSRFDECVRIHAWMVDLARDAKVDLFLDGGDIYERASVAEEREAVAEWLTRMAEVAPCLISRGNHDRPRDVFLMRRLHTRHPITVEEGAAVHHVAGAAIAAVAWPERAALLAQAGSIEGTENLIRDALQQVFRGLGAELAQHDGPRIGLMHGMIDGSIASTNQPLLGLPINIGLADLALIGADLGVVSHIHRAQRFQPPAGGPWLYAGSSHRTDHSQTERKSVIFAEFDGRRLVKLEEIETPATPMTNLVGRWNPAAGGGIDVPAFGDLTGHEVRLRFEVAADQREAAAAFARELKDRWLASGVKDVRLEPEVIVEARARAPEVAAASSLPDKLDAHWGAVGFAPGDRRQSLHSKACELEQQEASRAA